MMRIQIDATPLLLRSAGVKNYLYYWLRALREQAAGDEILAFPYLDEFGALTHEGSVIAPAGTWPRLGLLYFVNVPGNRAIDWIAARGDVFHASNQVRNPPRSVPLTATVHDMTCWLMPELHTPANVRADHNFAERVLKRAVGLIAVSESTKRDVVGLLDLDSDKVWVIHSGVAEAFFRVTGDQAQRAVERYRLERPYVLFVGTIEPRKNVDTLLDAYAGLPERVRSEVDLVVAGPAGWAAEQTQRRLEAGEGGVRYLGYVPEEDLPGLTAGAAVFVYVSLYEGFGFPVAQAMACGVPVVVSNVSSLPEIAGEGGVTVDPRSPAEISAALQRLLEDEGLREKLGRRGREIARRYRWSECARRSLEFFHAVAG